MSHIYTQPEILDRARLIAIAAGADPSGSPLNDNDFLAEVLYPHVVKTVIAREAASGNPDTRSSQNVVITDGVGTLPANVIAEELSGAYLNQLPQTMSVSWIAATDTITASAHRCWTGLPVVFSTSGTSVGGGIVAGTTYYVIYVTGNTLKIASSVANAVAGTAIDISAVAGDGTITMTPTYTQGTFSYVPRYMDYVRELPSPFGYWHSSKGNLYARAAGTSDFSSFDGTATLESYVFPKEIHKYTVAAVTHASDEFTLTSAIPVDIADGDRLYFSGSVGATVSAELTLNTYYFATNVSVAGRTLQLAENYLDAIAGNSTPFANSPAFSGTFYFTYHDLSLSSTMPVPTDIAEDIIIELAKAMRVEPPYDELGEKEQMK